MTKVVTYEDIKVLTKIEWGLSTEALQIASVFSKCLFYVLYCRRRNIWTKTWKRGYQCSPGWCAGQKGLPYSSEQVLQLWLQTCERMASVSPGQYSPWLDMTLKSKSCCKREGTGNRFEDSLRDERHRRVGLIRINCRRKNNLNAFTAIYSNKLNSCYKSVDSQRSGCTKSGFSQWPRTRTVSTLSAKMVSFDLDLVCPKWRRNIYNIHYWKISSRPREWARERQSPLHD